MSNDLIIPPGANDSGAPAPDPGLEPLSDADLNALRLRVVKGENISDEDLGAIVQTMRVRYARVKGGERAKTPKAKKAAPKIVDLDEFLSAPISGPSGN